MEKPKVMYELEIAHGSQYGSEEMKAISEVMMENAPSCGKRVKLFEDNFASYCGTKYALAVNNATSGLTLAGIAAGIEPGDEVISTPISWISSSSAFSVLGAKLVFCDVDPKTLNIDPDKLEALITPKTKAIVPVHLFGQCCEMDKIMQIAKKHNITVIEDCAHNPGGEYKGVKAGKLGDMGVFSFHQQKNMTTLGEGGMVTTDDKALFEKLLSFRSLCCRSYDPKGKYLPVDEKKYPMNREYWKLYFDDFGYNFRMTDIQAAVGNVQLNKLDQLNQRRIELAERLTEKLANVKGIQLPHVRPDVKHVYHIYMVLLTDSFPMSKRDFMWKLYTEKGIKIWSHYMLIHLMEPYTKQGHYKGECPVAENAFNYYTSLPIHPRLTDLAIDYMADSMIEVSGQK
jgi:perosamine synthetase